MKSRNKIDRKRGRHKKHASQETQRWNSDHLLPECPPWMSQETYVKLARLRDEPHVHPFEP